MRHHHHRQHDAGDDVADDHLDEHEVAAIGQARHADDGERAGLSRDDGEADAPPWDVFAAEEIIARGALVFAKPDAERDDAQQVEDDDQPVRDGEVIHAGENICP